MKIKIYHNPRCRKSRAGLDYLQKKTNEIEIIDYIKQGLEAETVIEIFTKLSIPAFEMVRAQEDIYKKQYKGKSFEEDEWAEIIAQNPKLLRRPVVIKDKKGVIGDPTENIDKLF